MKNLSTYICIIILTLLTVLAFLPFFRCINHLRHKEARVEGGVTPGGLSALKGVRGEDVWEKGEFIKFRKAFAHDRCSGNLVFNGEVKPAPYSEKDYFFTHVCDVCSATNQILNAQWPQFKQEWRPL